MAKSHFVPLRKTASGPHKTVLSLLKAIYPMYVILEEEPIRVGNRDLPVDLAIRELKVAIEVQGRQHYEFVEHFHRDQTGFEEQKRRDAGKRQAIIDAGWSYLAISDTQVAKLTRMKLIKLIGKAIKGD